VPPGHAVGKKLLVYKMENTWIVDVDMETDMIETDMNQTNLTYVLLLRRKETKVTMFALIIVLVKRILKIYKD